MSARLNPIVVIPARLGSSRLPNKPLADIHGAPMIVHVWRRAIAAQSGPVLVACAEEEVASAIRDAGGAAILTDPSLPSGSDRVFQALTKYDPEGRYDTIINLQGDLPAIDPKIIKAAAAPLKDEAVDIATLATPIVDPEERSNPNVVKIAATYAPGRSLVRALYFSRSAVPYGDGPLLHHIGIYAYRRQALARFVSLPPGLLETREKLEQLRALEAGMRIDVSIVDTLPLGVDTPADLERIRKVLEKDGVAG